MSNRIVTKDNFKVGDKVVLNEKVTEKGTIKSFHNRNIVYGIIIRTLFGLHDAVRVNWINHKGIVVDEGMYFIGHADIFELFFYE